MADGGHKRKRSRNADTAEPLHRYYTARYGELPERKDPFPPQSNCGTSQSSLTIVNPL